MTASIAEGLGLVVVVVVVLLCVSQVDELDSCQQRAGERPFMTMAVEEFESSRSKPRLIIFSSSRMFDKIKKKVIEFF